ncbi:unnamed protein product, partial [marine sediment metagenome]
YGLETIMLRYFNVFGPYQKPHSEYAAAIPKFLTAALTDQPAVIFGDGQQSRDFTFVNNVVEANMAAIAAPPEALGKVFNIACGESYSLLQLLDLLEHILGKKIGREFAEPRPGDVKYSLADVSSAEKYLGYIPRVEFKEGLKQTVEWFSDVVRSK